MALAFTVFPPTIVVEQDVNVSDVLQLLASHQLNGSSIRLTLPLLLMGPLYPLQLGLPTPTSVTLDLAGCIGCLSLADGKVHIYINNLHLKGLGPLTHGGASSAQNNSSGTTDISNGAQLSLPLWAFQFERLPGNASVHLYNVTLVLPREEFQMLLACLPAAVGPGSFSCSSLSGSEAGLTGLSLEVRTGYWPLTDPL